MISKISLKNFKSFKSLDGFEFTDLNILVGRNSCGKSTIMQSLLLLKQTVESSGEAHLSLDGQYLQYSDLSEIAFGLPRRDRATISYTIELQTTRVKGEVSVTFRNRKQGESYAVFSDFDISQAKSTQSGLREFLNDGAYASFSEIKKRPLEDLKSWIPFLDDEEIKDFSFSYNRFLPSSIIIHTEKSGSEPEFQVPVKFALNYSARILLDTFETSLKNIRYLSPVRARPSRYSVHYTEDNDELSSDGRNASHVLWTRRHEKVLFQGEYLQLAEAVNQSIELMQLKQKVAPTKDGSVLYKVSVEQKSSSKRVSLSDVGFGYSQVLPVVLICLLSSPDNLILIEQPEIHLHPSAAAALADFFIAVIKDGRKLVIETHSQELIHKLRLRVIEEADLAERININYVDSVDGIESEVRQFKLDRNGNFPKFPVGFLDESENIAREILKARVGKLGRD